MTEKKEADPNSKVKKIIIKKHLNNHPIYYCHLSNINIMQIHDMFYAKTVDGTSQFSFKIAATGNFTIDWGDGNIENIKYMIEYTEKIPSGLQRLVCFGKALDNAEEKINKTIDMNKFQEEVFVDMKPDGLNEYRDEYNNMLSQKMTSAKNNLETLKILTVSVKAETVLEAIDKFNNIEHILTERITAITTIDAEPINTIDRLELFNYIYNQDSSTPLYQKRKVNINS